MRTRTLLAALLALLVIGTGGSAAPGPHFREKLRGAVFPDPDDLTTGRAITLDLECRQQDPGDRFCGGTYHAGPARRLGGSPPPRGERDAKIEFVFEPLDTASLNPTIRAAGLDEIAFNTTFADGVTCDFDGLAQDVAVSVRIPAIRGRYICRGAAGAVVEAGIFSVEFVSFTALSRYS